jgi:hypothetical protein
MSLAVLVPGGMTISFSPAFCFGFTFGLLAAPVAPDGLARGIVFRAKLFTGYWDSTR